MPWQRVALTRADTNTALFGQSARDPVTYGLVGAVLILVALLASAAPALRATRADPNAALRSD